MIYPYETTQNESQIYRRQQDPICSADRENPKQISIKEAKITQMVMNSPIDDCLFYVDENNQLLKVALALDGTDVESTNSEYVHGPFHQD